MDSYRPRNWTMGSTSTTLLPSPRPTAWTATRDLASISTVTSGNILLESQLDMDDSFWGELENSDRCDVNREEIASVDTSDINEIELNHLKSHVQAMRLEVEALKASTSATTASGQSQCSQRLCQNASALEKEALAVKKETIDCVNEIDAYNAPMQKAKTQLSTFHGDLREVLDSLLCAINSNVHPANIASELSLYFNNFKSHITESLDVISMKPALDLVSDIQRLQAAKQVCKNSQEELDEQMVQQTLALDASKREPDRLREARRDIEERVETAKAARRVSSTKLEHSRNEIVELSSKIEESRKRNAQMELEKANLASKKQELELHKVDLLQKYSQQQGLLSSVEKTFSDRRNDYSNKRSSLMAELTARKEEALREESERLSAISKLRESLHVATEKLGDLKKVHIMAKEHARLEECHCKALEELECKTSSVQFEINNNVTAISEVESLERTLESDSAARESLKKELNYVRQDYENLLRDVNEKHLSYEDLKERVRRGEEELRTLQKVRVEAEVDFEKSTKKRVRDAPNQNAKPKRNGRMKKDPKAEENISNSKFPNTQLSKPAYSLKKQNSRPVPPPVPVSTGHSGQNSRNASNTASKAMKTTKKSTALPTEDCRERNLVEEVVSGNVLVNTQTASEDSAVPLAPVRMFGSSVVKNNGVESPDKPPTASYVLEDSLMQNSLADDQSVHLEADDQLEDSLAGDDDDQCFEQQDESILDDDGNVYQLEDSLLDDDRSVEQLEDSLLDDDRSVQQLEDSLMNASIDDEDDNSNLASDSGSANVDKEPADSDVAEQRKLNKKDEHIVDDKRTDDSLSDSLMLEDSLQGGLELRAAGDGLDDSLAISGDEEVEAAPKYDEENVKNIDSLIENDSLMIHTSFDSLSPPPSDDVDDSEDYDSDYCPSGNKKSAKSKSKTKKKQLPKKDEKRKNTDGFSRKKSVDVAVEHGFQNDAGSVVDSTIQLPQYGKFTPWVTSTPLSTRLEDVDASRGKSRTKGRGRGRGRGRGK